MIFPEALKEYSQEHQKMYLYTFEFSDFEIIFFPLKEAAKINLEI